MRLALVLVAGGAFLAGLSAVAGASDDSLQANDPPDVHPAGEPADAVRKTASVSPFAPMWIGVPRFPGETSGERAAPSSSYAMLWQEEWQRELSLTPQQQETLRTIHEQAMAEIEKRTAEFQKLSREEQQAEATSWGGKSAPWRQQIDHNLNQQIEAMLTAEQLRTLRDYSFPMLAVGLLYDDKVRTQLDIDSRQEDALRGVIQQKLARTQKESLKRAEQVWALLGARQQNECGEIVKRQGPTSAALSIAWELGFYYDDVIPSYPLLAVAPVRERLGITAEQKEQLRLVQTDSALRRKKGSQGAAERKAEVDEKRRVEAVLTPRQLTTLAEIDFRRRVALALSDKEKRRTIGMTDNQEAELRALDEATHEKLYRLDRAMLGRALEILMPRQRERIDKEVNKRLGG